MKRAGHAPGCTGLILLLQLRSCCVCCFSAGGRMHLRRTLSVAPAHRSPVQQQPTADAAPSGECTSVHFQELSSQLLPACLPTSLPASLSASLPASLPACPCAYLSFRPSLRHFICTLPQHIVQTKGPPGSVPASSYRLPHASISLCSNAPWPWHCFSAARAVPVICSAVFYVQS